MNPYEPVDQDLNTEPHPMRRLPIVHSIIRDVTQFELSETTVEVEKANLVRDGFTVGDVTQKYDPAIGYITEYWGYRNV